MEVLSAELCPEDAISIANDTTVGRISANTNKSLAWSINQILSEHSTLDFASIIVIEETRSDVVSHIVRHTTHYPRFAVQSFRPDWTGQDRPKDQAQKRKFVSKWPYKAVIAMARQRLCMKSMKETRDWVLTLKQELLKSNKNIMKALGFAMVPECVYRGGCPFGPRGCGYYDNIKTDNTIAMRYKKYLESIGMIDMWGI